MIVLRRKLTGKEQTFNPAYFNRNKIDFSQYDILEWNVIELVWGNNEEISEGWYDAEHAKAKIDKSSPTMNYRFKDVPRPDLNILDQFAPIQKESAPKITNQNPVTVSRRKKSLIIVENISKNKLLIWIANNIALFIFYVLIGIAIWYFTIFKPIIHK